MNGAALESYALSFGFIACRFSALLFALPLLGEMLPVRARVAIGLLLAAAVTLEVGPATTTSVSFSTLAGAAASELAVGFTIAFCVRALFAAVASAGQIVGAQLGLSFAGSADPMLREESIVTTKLLTAFTWLGFIAAGGIETVVGALILSVRRIAPGSVITIDLSAITNWMTEAMTVAMRLALPVLAGMLVLQFALAIVSRVVAELNAFSFAFAAMTGVGLVFLVALFEPAVSVGAELTDRFVAEIGAAWRAP